MTFEKIIGTKTAAHEGDAHAERFGEATYRVGGTTWGDEVPAEPDIYPTCSYCGSIPISVALASLVKKGTTYSGCDWKYGWPHKFYIDISCEAYKSCVGGKSEQQADGKMKNVYQFGVREKRHHKFYADHIVDATTDELEMWNRIAGPLLGVKYQRVDGKMKFMAACGGFQTWGTIGGPVDVNAPFVPEWFVKKEF